MAVGPVGFSIEQQDLLWRMWRGGESLRTMGRSLGVSMPRIQRFLRLTGGVRPGPQRRREGHLGAGEREEISRGIAAGLSGRVIAGRLGRSPSSVSREIERNGGRGAYRAVDADAAAYYRALRPKPSKGDLVFGARPSAVATLVDRATRFTMVLALPDGYKADTVAAAVVEQMATLPTELRRSLTWDRGRERAAHASITAALSMPVFFCDPRHPWRRGTNENTNRLLRQYLHKKADLSALT